MSEIREREMKEPPIIGYLDAFSARPGGTLGVHVSVKDDLPYRAALMRIRSLDPNPAGPGFRWEDLSATFSKEIAGRYQPTYLGSYARIPDGPRLDSTKPHSWTCMIWSNLLQDPPRVVLASGDGDLSVQLMVGRQGVAATWGDGTGKTTVATGAPIPLRSWYRLWVSIDPQTGRMTVGQTPVDRYRSSETVVRTEICARRSLPSEAPVTIGALGDAPARLHFNGRVEEPAILSGYCPVWTDALSRPDGLSETVALWDFSREIPTLQVKDTGEQGCHGTLINLPMRAVRGARWTGQEMCWRHAPDHYAAIHFHEDDLNDCGWEKDFDLVIPDPLPSGSYALRLTCEADEEWLPFFVPAPVEGPHAPIAVLMSTFSYLAYAAQERRNADAAYHERNRRWGAYPHNPDDYPIYGRSTYNLHSDGSGIAFASILRPLLNVRPGFVTYNYPHSSGLRNYPVDHYMLAWLEAKGFAFDVITDHDLHREGEALLAPYKTIITGSHPEYHTFETYDALMAYTRTGGHLAYLGGNGFYWRIALSDAVPGTMEIRRAEGGIRTWAAEPGEYYHQFDGAYGGLMQRNGRAPYRLVGVGHSSFGEYEGSYYRRGPGSYRPEVAWIFDGVDETILGDYGLVGGGAAGYEVDRAVPLFGTPDNAIILASATKADLPASFMTNLEDLRSPQHPTLSGEKPDDIIRCDMVYFDTPGGGAVFSVGSICFSGSLWKDGDWQGPISRILENVIGKFSGR